MKLYVAIEGGSEGAARQGCVLVGQYGGTLLPGIVVEHNGVDEVA